MSRTDLPNDARSKTNRGRVANALRFDEPSSQRPAPGRLKRRRRGAAPSSRFQPSHCLRSVRGLRQGRSN